jgi:hypothetical protein
MEIKSALGERQPGRFFHLDRFPHEKICLISPSGNDTVLKPGSQWRKQTSTFNIGRKGTTRLNKDGGTDV